MTPEIGTRINRWLVVGPVVNARLPCRCSCGVRRTVDAYALTSGRSRSCGCDKQRAGPARKIDTLWDSPASPAEIAAALHEQALFDARQRQAREARMRAVFAAEPGLSIEQLMERFDAAYDFVRRVCPGAQSEQRTMGATALRAAKVPGINYSAWRKTASRTTKEDVASRCYIIEMHPPTSSEDTHARSANVGIGREERKRGAA